MIKDNIVFSLKVNIILENSRIDILELVQCVGAMLIAQMGRPVCCRLLNQTSFSRAMVDLDANKLTKQLAEDIQQAIDSVEYGVTIKFSVVDDHMHFDFYCDDQSEKYFSTIISGKPKLEESLPELIGEPIKVRIQSDDRSLQHCFRSFEQGLNIECIAQSSNETADSPCHIEIKDCRATSDVYANLTKTNSHSTIVLRTMQQLQERERTDEISLYWPFFDSDLHNLLGDIKHLRKLRVFVADDSQPSKMTTIIMLEHLGCILTGADDGIEALELTSKQPFDLIFLDERMPGLLGSDVASQLRDGNGVNANTPKISLTGITDRDSVAELYRKGITHHIEKPITKLVLENFLQQYRKIQLAQVNETIGV